MANEDLEHVALPKLYGAPAYARPRVVAVQPAERPFDPDALPLEAVQTDEERELADRLVAHPGEGGSAPDPVTDAGETVPVLRPRAFRLRTITGRFRGADDGPGT